MILMTVFLVLTLVFIIGTSIYLNNKKIKILKISYQIY